MNQISCEKVASPDKQDLTTFCSTSGLWCPIRLYRVCEKRLDDGIQLATNVMFDPNIFVQPAVGEALPQKPERSQGVKVSTNSRRNLRYKRR